MRDHFIQVFEGVFDQKFCDKIIELFESENPSFKTMGKVGYAATGADMKSEDDMRREVSKVKSSIDMVIPFPEHPQLDSYTHKDDWLEIFDAFTQAAGNCMMEYNDRIQDLSLDKYCEHRKEHVIAQLNSPRQISVPQIQKYTEGGYFSWHADYIPGKDRIMGMIFYLNDVDEDADGTTEFLNDVHVRPKAGKIVMFPADWRTLHRGNVLKHGSKYVVSMFTSHEVTDSQIGDLVRARDELKYERDDLLKRIQSLQNQLQNKKPTTATDYAKFERIAEEISSDDEELVEDLSAEDMVDPIRDNGPEPVREGNLVTED